MPIHLVEQGEFISKIALRYGFTDWRTVWNHPRNSGLRRIDNMNDLRQRESRPWALYL